MHLVCRTAPASLADLMLQSVCDHLRVVYEPGDSPPIEPPDLDYIRTCTETAVARVDGKAGRLNRCLLTQEWSLFLDYFPGAIGMALPPLQEVTAIKYVAEDGTTQTMDAADYVVSGSSSWQPIIEPAPGTTWPSTRYQADAVEVQFTAGYGDADTDIPAPILQAIRILAAHYYTEREALTFATNVAKLPLTVRDLLSPYRIWC